MRRWHAQQAIPNVRITHYIPHDTVHAQHPTDTVQTTTHHTAQTQYQPPHDTEQTTDTHTNDILEFYLNTFNDATRTHTTHDTVNTRVGLARTTETKQVGAREAGAAVGSAKWSEGVRE